MWVGRLTRVDSLRFGATIRVARIRRGWRQSDLAAAAGVSRGTVSRIERGAIHEISFGTLVAVAGALDVRLELLTRSRGADLDRLLNQKHAALAEAVIARLRAIGGWVVRPEVSFSEWGERGIVDLLAWHERSASVLVIELKTDIIDVGELLGTLDRKRRLGIRVAASLGWPATSVATCLIVGESMSNRRRVEARARTFRAALPDDGRRARAWLRDPAGDLRALLFVSNARPGSVRSSFATVRRVSRCRRLAAPADSRTTERGSIGVESVEQGDPGRILI
ncbi:MAG: Helix-turn-helix domain [Chloroflexota bacterium]|nr:Helix-turn-helix domain [Chloroflexota bacterium]